MKKTSNLDNGQFLKHLCDFAHPLAGVFIIDALVKQYKDVLANKEEILKEEKRSIISPEAWIECAEQLKIEINKRHGL